MTILPSWGDDTPLGGDGFALWGGGDSLRLPDADWYQTIVGGVNLAALIGLFLLALAGAGAGGMAADVLRAARMPLAVLYAAL